MNCKEINSLLTPYLLGDLEPEKNNAITEHLETCQSCQAELDLLQPTLALLTEALEKPATAQKHLEFTRRKQVIYPSKGQNIISWISTGHPRFAIAAGFAVVVGMLWVIVFTSTTILNRGRFYPSEGSAWSDSGSSFEEIPVEFAIDCYARKPSSESSDRFDRSDRSYLLSVAKPEPMEDIEEPQSLNGRREDKRATRRVAQIKSAPTSGMSRRSEAQAERHIEARRARESGMTTPKENVYRFKVANRAKQDALKAIDNVEAIRAETILPVAPPSITPIVDVIIQSAEFDSVAMVKSPMIMSGIYGARSPGARGAALKRYGGGNSLVSDSDIDEDYDSDEVGVTFEKGTDFSIGVTAGTAVNTYFLSAEAEREEIPFLGDAPLLGRSFSKKSKRGDKTVPNSYLGAKVEKFKPRDKRATRRVAQTKSEPTSGRRIKPQRPPALSAGIELHWYESENPETLKPASDSWGIAGESEEAENAPDPWEGLAYKSGYSIRKFEELSSAVKSSGDFTAMEGGDIGVKSDRTFFDDFVTVGGAVDLATADKNIRKAEDEVIDFKRLHDIGRVDGYDNGSGKHLVDLSNRKKELRGKLVLLQEKGEKQAQQDSLEIGARAWNPGRSAGTPIRLGNIGMRGNNKSAKRLQDELAAIEKVESRWKNKNLLASQRQEECKRLSDKVSIVEAKYNSVYTRLHELHEEKTKEKAEDPSPEPQTRIKAYGVNPLVNVAEKPFSTFAIDVDTAAYTLGRGYMLRGELPPTESVRTEEYVNFFDYGYKAPQHYTFRVYTEVAPSKFGHGLHLMKIGVKGRRLGREEQRQAVLTFLIDTSGSMNQPDRLGMVQHSLELLVNELNPNDLVAIVQYDSRARLLLEHTPASDKGIILKAIKRLQCSGSTNLEEGMHKAYAQAAANFVPKGENRVLLLSDGVANLGSCAAEDILAKVAKYRDQGITCSVFGFGMGAYDDSMLETLANKGDGAYSFIDSKQEAQRVFVDDLSATLNTIAADVKIQVEYNPTYVAKYRQLGYENRQLKKEDFRNDAVDAGEIGSGQSVTALYELDLNVPQQLVASPISDLRPSTSDVIATVRVRYRRIDTGEVEEIEHLVHQSDLMNSFDKAPSRFKLAAGVAEFAEILRMSPFAQGSTMEDVAKVLRPVALDMSLDSSVQELLRMAK